jgi:hypothetical protein
MNEKGSSATEVDLWVVVGHVKELKSWMDFAVLSPKLHPVASGPSMVKPIPSRHYRP